MDEQVNLKALENLVTFYEMWGFRLWKMVMSTDREDGVTEADYHKLWELGFAEESTADVEAAMEGETGDLTKVMGGLITATFGKKWLWWKITPKGLEYWKSLNRKTWWGDFKDKLSEDE